MKYEEWTELVQTTNDPNYYTNLIKFAPIIAEKMKTHKLHVIAEELHLSRPKFSTLKPLLEAVAKWQQSV